jgi:hypothetical protein
MRRILFVFSSTLWTSVTFLPYRVAFLLYSFCVVFVRENKKQNPAEQYQNMTSNYSTFATQIQYNQIYNESSHTQTHLFDDEDLSFGGHTDRCSPPEIKFLIDMLFMFLLLGTIGNPIITIRTQNTYLNRVILMCSNVTRSIQLPARLRPSLTRGESEVDDITTTATSENGDDEYMSSLRSTSTRSISFESMRDRRLSSLRSAISDMDTSESFSMIEMGLPPSTTSNGHEDVFETNNPKKSSFRTQWRPMRHNKRPSVIFEQDVQLTDTTYTNDIT